MAANASALRIAIVRWAGNVHSDALDSMPERMQPDTPLGKVTPTSRPPGTLRASYKVEHRAGTGDRFRGGLVNPAIQGVTTDQGARPHVIVPVRARRLRFYWPKVGAIVYRSRVNHPGNQPQRWWDKALRKHWPMALVSAAARRPFQ